MNKYTYTKGKRCIEIDCNKLITNEATRCKSCANRLRSKGNNHKGKNNPNWQGGIRETSEGRILLYAPDNEMSDSRGYVRRSRLVLAEKLGRNLEPEEICHHINFNTKDDRPGNLRQFRNHSAHSKYHKTRVRSIMLEHKPNSILPW